MDDVVIVGAGPAGLTAALYTGRAKLKTRVLEKLAVGGQVLLTELIENFPGVYKMNSYAWVDIMKRQLADLKDVQIAEEAKVEAIENQNGLFKTHIICEADQRKDVLESRCVIIATGALPKRLGIRGEEMFIGHGVSYCATCDGPLFKDKDIILVGGGDAAIEEALYLTKFVRKLTIIHRRDALRATALLQERVMADQKIDFKWETVPVEIMGRTRVEGIKIRNLKNNQEEILPCEGIFVFIGASPNTDFVRGFLDLNEYGYIVTDETMMSSCTGVFASGDCRSRPLNQVVTACSDGAIAAFAVSKFLANKI